MNIGGDTVPGYGTRFLKSFWNTGKRVVSSHENLLIFGSDVKEESTMVIIYISKLVADLTISENRVFKITTKDGIFSVEFKLQGLPNDMKMTAFLAGEFIKFLILFFNLCNSELH